MAIALGQIPDLLRPGLAKVNGEYKKSFQEWKSVFVDKSSKLNTEISVHMQHTGPAREKFDGSAMYADNNAGSKYKYNMEHTSAGIQMAITRQALVDDLYNQLDNAKTWLRKSVEYFWNVKAAQVFNTASTYDANIGGDGKALLATDHPYALGSWGNTSSTPRSLSESSLLNAGKQIRMYKELSGMLINAEQDRLIIPPSLEPVAARLTLSELRPGTGDNDINVIRKAHGGTKGYYVWRYLTSDYAWFLLSDVKAFTHYIREALETDSHIDPATKNLIVDAYERGGFFCDDPRALWGEVATA